jgi:hypothetical protein
VCECVLRVKADSAFNPCSVVYEIIHVMVIVVIGWIQNCCSAMM